MNVNDYLIDHTGIDWKEMLSDWFWLLPNQFTPWLVNRFGDIFFVCSDDTVHLLDTGTGQATKVAENRNHFCELIDKENNANEWLLIPLIDSLVEAGKKLIKNQCYSFITFPGLGGQYVPENVEVCDLSVHYSVSGQIFEKIKDIPDETKVQFEIK